MKITAKADVTDIRAKLRKYSELMGREVSSGVRQFAVVACRNLANTTQPFSGRDKETSRSGRWKGEFAVESDIRKVFYVPTVDGGFVKALTEKARANYQSKGLKSGSVSRQSDRFQKRVNRYVSNGNFTALRNIAKDMKLPNFARTVDPAIHERARTGRRKRVKKPPEGMTLILNKPETLDRYIKKRQKMVGLTKAAWAKCADRIPAAKKGSATRGIPQWVTRNKGKSSGDIQDRSRDARNPRVIMTNRLPWASNCITSNETRKAVELAKRNFVEYLNKTVKAELRRRTNLKAT